MSVYAFGFYDVVGRNARSFPDGPAWLEVDTGSRLTFAAYKERVDQVAAGLRAAGIAAGDRIGVLGKNSCEFFLLYGAAAALGAILVPINWRLSAEEVAFNLGDVTPTLLFVDQAYQTLVEGIRPQLTSLRGCYNLKGDAGDFTAFSELTEPQKAFAPAPVDGDTGFVIIHTAAVAGRPRGALLSHANLLCASLQFQYYFGLDQRDVHLNLLPLFHVGGLFTAISAFHAGALNVNMSKFDAAQAVDLITAHKVSFFFDFTPILGAILDAHKEKGGDLSSLRNVVGLDTPETIEAYQATTGGRFFAMFGQTETSCLATMSPYDECPGSAGRVIPMAQVSLLDDDDQPVPAGETGEIAVRGPMVFKGYWNLAEDTAQTFRNGWHHTGDLGRFDENGFLFYAGRKPEKELIKPGGENVYPAEVEAAILEHPAVGETVVFGVPDPKWKEGIKAVCVLNADQDLEAMELIQFVGDRIARYKKPQYVEFVAELPKSADGSIDRAAVKAQYGGAQ
ncbi:MAG: AMP-binding protein [Desulfosarcinaceae bacterium]|nr:AMP-binding protein [Desulfosarcinaceae bacterium]